METRLSTLTDRVPKVIDPKTHAILDYATAGTFLVMGLALMGRHRRASGLAFISGFSVLGLSLLTDYPGGVYRRLSFATHGVMDAVQAGMSALGPAMLGFADEPEASLFYGQAALETGVIAATDWNAA